MSASDDYALAVSALDNGADDFIHKPPNPEELRARLRLADRVTAMKQQMVHQATVDDLTQLFNRRAFMDIAAAKILNHPDEAISAIIFDVDFFKKINDTYGHKRGTTCSLRSGNISRMRRVSLGGLGARSFV